LNPEPLAVFVDFFLLGDAEAGLYDFLDVFLDTRSKGVQRHAVVLELARRLSWLYAPSLYQTEYRKDGTIRRFLPKHPHVPARVKVARWTGGGSECGLVPMSTVSSPEIQFGNKVLIEMGRGCGRSCRFCAAGYIYRPPRVYGESDLVSSLEQALTRTDQVGLLSAAVSDVPGIENLTSLVLRKGARFSVSSLRADTLTPRLLHHLKEAGQKTVAIAPETGSERLRRVANKHLTTEQIMEAVRLIESTGEFNLRLYFLVGLPSETKEDVADIVDLVKHMKHHMIKESVARGRVGQIRMSVNCFIPKPFTPFQWFPLEQVSSLKEKRKWLQRSLAKEGGIRINFDIPKWAYVQTLLSMGDRRVGSILLLSHRFKADWAKALRHAPVNPDFFVYRPKELDEILAWDFIDHGIRKEYLQSEYQLALKAEESEICRVGDCYRCGVCTSLENAPP